MRASVQISPSRVGHRLGDMGLSGWNANNPLGMQSTALARSLHCVCLVGSDKQRTDTDETLPSGSTGSRKSISGRELAAVYEA